MREGKDQNLKRIDCSFGDLGYKGKKGEYNFFLPRTVTEFMYVLGVTLYW